MDDQHALTRVSKLTPMVSVAEAKDQIAKLREFVSNYLVPDEDYGVIPGTEKLSMYQSGAEKLMEIYGLRAEYEIVGITEDWAMVPPLFDYTVKCRLFFKGSEPIEVGSEMASCNSHEAKYKYRRALNACPECGTEAIIKGRAEYGGGWLCWGKKGGCGMKWPDDEAFAAPQDVPNMEVADQKNTILQMAEKRAKVRAARSVTRSSGIFTQDIEDRSGEPYTAIEAEAVITPVVVNEDDPQPPPVKKRAAKKRVRKAAAPESTGPADTGGPSISPPQLRRLYAIARGAGLIGPGDDDTDLRKLVFEEAGVAHANEISPDAYDAVIDAVKAVAQ